MDRNLKITLIIPSYSKILGISKFCRFGVYPGLGKIPERPHIGMGYLSEALSMNGYGHDLIDMNLISYSDFKKRTKYYSPDIIGLTLITPGYLKSYELLKQIKNDFPKSKIIVGGHHISAVLKQIIQDCPQIEVCFIGESEKSLIDYCKNNCDPQKVNGVIYKDGQEVILNQPKLEKDIDQFQFPKYKKFALKKYSGIALYTSRGCPYNCIFCSVESSRRREFRARSITLIIEEIEYWYERGERLFAIEDDNFTFDTERIFKLCDEIEKLKLQDLFFNLGQGVRADKTSRSLLKRMYEVGFRYITIAAEGGNNKILKRLKKAETIEKIEETVKNSCDIGYEVRLLFVVGAPGETWQDLEDSFKLAQKYPIMYSRFNNLLPIPGTELFEWVERNKLFISPPEEYLNSDYLDYAIPLYETPELTAEERRKAIIISDRINQTLFYRYLSQKFRKLFFLRRPVAYLASRRFVQYLISRYPFLYKLGLFVRRMIG